MISNYLKSANTADIGYTVMDSDLSQTIELSHCSAADEKTSSRRWSYRRSTLNNPYDLEENHHSMQVGHNNVLA